MSNYTLYDLNSPATWFDTCGMTNAYLPSTVWTDYSAMFSDSLVQGSLLSAIQNNTGMTWNLSWAIVNKSDPAQAAQPCYSGFTSASAAAFATPILGAAVALLAVTVW